MKNYLIAVFLCLGILSLSAQTIYYVKQGGTGTGTGSWANASGDLQAVMNLAYDGGGGEVWVAAGVYIPMRLANNYTATSGTSISSDNAFVLRPNVRVYGGFAGNEGTAYFHLRDINANPSILRGLLKKNGLTAPSTRTYHVVVSVGDVGNAVLNGFTIERGNANEGGGINVNGINIYKQYGGGIYLINSSPTLKHLKIINNSAISAGGGIYIQNSNAFITNVLISNNSTVNDGSKGGGIACEVGGNPTLTNVELSNNSSNYGGGIYMLNTRAVLTNVTIAGNTATSGGSGIYCNNQAQHIVKIQNSIIYGNTGSVNASGLNVSYCEYSLINGFTTAGTNNNLSGNTNPMFESGSYKIQWNSPCAEVGNRSYFSSGMIPDLSGITTEIQGYPRIGNYLEWVGQTYTVIKVIDLGCYQVTCGMCPAYPSFYKNYNPYSDNDNKLEVENKIELNIFPNPINANQQINISLGNYYSPVDVKVYSLDGKLIHNKAYKGGSFKLEVPDLAPGIYIINVQTQEGKTFTKKIVVNK